MTKKKRITISLDFDEYEMLSHLCSFFEETKSERISKCIRLSYIQFKKNNLVADLINK